MLLTMFRRLSFGTCLRMMSFLTVALLGWNVVLAQKWTYELTIVRGPEQVDEAALRAQLQRMGVGTKESDFEEALSVRKKGYSRKTVVTYSRDGSRIEGHIRTLNGVKLEFDAGRFLLDESGFYSYLGANGASGILEVQGPESFRSRFSLMEEELLMGDGKLIDRFQALRTGYMSPDKLNTWEESFVATDEGIDVLHGKTLRYHVAYDENKSELVIDKVVTPVKEKLIFREIDSEEFKRFEDFVPVGTPVSDYRIDKSFPSQYQWQGVAPSIEELGKMNRDRGSRSVFPTVPVVSLCVLITGFVTLLVSRKRKRNR